MKSKTPWKGLAVIALVIYIMIDGPLGWKLTKSVYNDLFGLNSESSVSAYKKASIDKKLDFINSICVNIDCFDDIDFSCGMGWNNEIEFLDIQERVTDCFYMTIKTASKQSNLAEIVLRCGKKNLNFSPWRSEKVSPSECVTRGGEWGVVSPN